MLAVIGTVPDPDFPLVYGEADLDRRNPYGGRPCLPGEPGHPGPAGRGCANRPDPGPAPYPTPFSSVTSAWVTAVKSSMNISASIWRRPNFTTLCFHYLLPDVDWHNRVLFAIEDMARRPILIADAGFMYVAKMSGQAGQYDLFTPDVGELAFLADEEAPHPFYTRGFILHEDNLAPDLINRAYTFDNAAKYLLVKGKVDYVAAREGILATVTEPDLEVLEPIGGTGDTITGIVAALIDAGTIHPIRRL